MIASVGDASIDSYVTTGEKHVGGIATNFVVHATRFNYPAILISAIGDDEDGEFFLRQMKMENVDVSHLKRLPGATSEQKIRLVGRERVFCGFFAGVLADMKLDEHDIELMREAEAVVAPLTDGLKQVFDQVIDSDLGLDTLKIADFSRDADIEGFAHGDVAAMLFHYLDRIDMAFIGGDESLIETVSAIAEANPEKILVLTLGPKGSICYHNGETYKQKAFWIKNIVDTTGCGDAFRAGFVTNYMRNKNISEALETAAQLAADAATHFGAF
ncbi:MAG: PfkB family carbohydrate kinase [Candidatus Kerfeldbacteria bacterium]